MAGHVGSDWAPRRSDLGPHTTCGNETTSKPNPLRPSQTLSDPLRPSQTLISVYVSPTQTAFQLSQARALISDASDVSLSPLIMGTALLLTLLTAPALPTHTIQTDWLLFVAPGDETSTT